MVYNHYTPSHITHSHCPPPHCIAGELSGVPDGRGGVLPTIKQVPGYTPLVQDGRPLSRGHPPPLAVARPSSQVSLHTCTHSHILTQIQGRGITPLQGRTPGVTPQFISGAPLWRPMRQVSLTSPHPNTLHTPHIECSCTGEQTCSFNGYSGADSRGKR